METKRIDANQFWDIYFRNRFIMLRRNAGGYIGRANLDSRGAGAPSGMLRQVEAEEVHIEVELLRQYDCARDGRFALMGKPPVDIGRAWSSVIDQNYPFRDPAPFGKQRMAELFRDLKENVVPSSAQLRLATLEDTTIMMVNNYTESLNQQLAALAWFLGERRTRSSSQALISIVSNAAFVPATLQRIHFTPVDAALSALWKVNDKNSLGKLLALMKVTTDAGSRKIAPLFERLLSTKELLSLEACGDDYFKPDFWANQLNGKQSFNALDWDRYDADSLFWEIRYLAALRLPSNDPALTKLCSDEVQTVRAKAAARRV